MPQDRPFDFPQGERATKFPVHPKPVAGHRARACSSGAPSSASGRTGYQVARATQACCGTLCPCVFFGGPLRVPQGERAAKFHVHHKPVAGHCACARSSGGPFEYLRTGPSSASGRTVGCSGRLWGIDPRASGRALGVTSGRALREPQCERGPGARLCVGLGAGGSGEAGAGVARGGDAIRCRSLGVGPTRLGSARFRGTGQPWGRSFGRQTGRSRPGRRSRLPSVELRP